MLIDELQQANKLREKITGIDGIIAAMQSAEVKTLAPLIEIEQAKQDATRAKLAVLLPRLSRQIQNEITDTTLQKILIRRYVAGESFNEIAKALHFACRYVYELHAKALKIIASPDNSKRFAPRHQTK